MIYLSHEDGDCGLAVLKAPKRKNLPRANAKNTTTTDKNRHLDMATIRLNQVRGRLTENIYNLYTNHRGLIT